MITNNLSTAKEVKWVIMTYLLSLYGEVELIPDDHLDHVNKATKLALGEDPDEEDYTRPFPTGK